MSYVNNRDNGGFVPSPLCGNARSNYPPGTWLDVSQKLSPQSQIYFNLLKVLFSIQLSLCSEYKKRSCHFFLPPHIAVIGCFADEKTKKPSFPVNQSSRALPRILSGLFAVMKGSLHTLFMLFSHQKTCEFFLVW